MISSQYSCPNFTILSVFRREPAVFRVGMVASNPVWMNKESCVTATSVVEDKLIIRSWRIILVWAESSRERNCLRQVRDHDRRLRQLMRQAEGGSRMRPRSWAILCICILVLVNWYGELGICTPSTDVHLMMMSNSRVMDRTRLPIRCWKFLIFYHESDLPFFICACLEHWVGECTWRIEALRTYIPTNPSYPLDRCWDLDGKGNLTHFPSLSPQSNYNAFRISRLRASRE